MKKILGICLVASFVFSEDLLAWGTAADQIVKRDNELRGKLTSTIDKLEQVNKDNVAANAANTALREESAKLNTTIDGLSKGEVNIEALKTLEQKEAAVKEKFEDLKSEVSSVSFGMLDSIFPEDPAQATAGKYNAANNQTGYNSANAMNVHVRGNNPDPQRFFAQLAVLGDRAVVNGNDGCIAGNHLSGYFRSMMEAYVVGNMVDTLRISGFEKAAEMFYTQSDSIPLSNLNETHGTSFNSAYDMNKAISLGYDFSNTSFVMADGVNAFTWAQYLNAASPETQQDRINALLDFLGTVINSKGVQIVTAAGQESLSYAYQIALVGQVLGLFAKDGNKKGDGTVIPRAFLGKAADQDGGLYAYEKELTTAQRTKLVEILYRLLVNAIKSFE